MFKLKACHVRATKLWKFNLIFNDNCKRKLLKEADRETWINLVKARNQVKRIWTSEKSRESFRCWSTLIGPHTYSFSCVSIPGDAWHICIWFVWNEKGKKRESREVYVFLFLFLCKCQAVTLLSTFFGKVMRSIKWKSYRSTFFCSLFKPIAEKIFTWMLDRSIDGFHYFHFRLCRQRWTISTLSVRNQVCWSSKWSCHSSCWDLFPPPNPSIPTFPMNCQTLPAHSFLTNRNPHVFPQSTDCYSIS